MVKQQCPRVTPAAHAPVPSLRLAVIFGWWLICFGPRPGAAQSHSFRAIDQAFVGLQNERAFSGSVLVAKKGRIVYQQFVGFADREHRVPITAETTFEIASLAKPFTALLVLQLVEKGTLNLESPVSAYIPEFSRRDAEGITLHHLLSHTSGLQDFVGLNCAFAAWTEKEFLAGLQTTPLSFPAGSQFAYASSTYVLLRFIIERVTGRSYAQNLQEHVLQVAGMTHTGVIANHALLDKRALGYVRTEHGYQNALPIANHEIFLGAASIYSTAADLLRFDQALYGTKLLGARAKERMFTVVQPPYGYG
jgi:CubicO group peptidase (beta-lactamase class C family)